MTHQATDPAGVAGYVGADILEVMEGAENYTAELVRMVAGEAGGARALLDFGAGRGDLAVRLADLGFSVTCVEPDARLRLTIAAKGLTALAEVPAEASCDLVYSISVLEHLEDDAGALRTLYEALAPGGKLVIYVPAFMSLYSSFDRRIGHFRRYRRANLARALEAAGFVVARSRYVDSLGYGAGLLYRLVGPANGSLNRTSLVLYDRFVFPLSRMLDRLLGRFVGKNVLAVARKPGVASKAEA